MSRAEVNGAANIILALDLAKALGQPVDFRLIHTEALALVEYLKLCEVPEDNMWGPLRRKFDKPSAPPF